MALEYGMSAEEFWRDDPQLFVSYRTAYINKKQRQLEEQDYISWLNGLYVYDGNSKLNALLRQTITNMVAKTPSREKIPPYPDKPYSEGKKEQKTIDREKEYYDSIIGIGTMKQRYLEKIKNKKKGEK